MDKTAIEVSGVEKVFKLPTEKSNSIKSYIIQFFKGGKKSYTKLTALKDINFKINKGEFFGIVGRNGSGKSTLLKILSGIYSPTKGSIHINGKLTPFIELGVGFNPELTGKENIYLNGALLGFSRSDMNKMYDDIVNFAELDKFMDQKLKNYSTGMQVRLAFSIAIRVKGDILILDEVLAVGDESFQLKCVEHFLRLKEQKQTVVLVTHDMKHVEQFCDRALVLNEGKMVKLSSPKEAAITYRKLNGITKK